MVFLHGVTHKMSPQTRFSHSIVLMFIVMVLFLSFITGKYVGSRPIRLRKSTWKDRSFLEVRKKEKEKKKLGLK